MGRGTGFTSGAVLNAPALFSALRRWNVSPCPAPLHLWGSLPAPIRPAPRLTHEWTEAELDYLELWYLLKGSAFIRSKYPHLTSDSCRQMATRLRLVEDLLEFTPASEVAEEGGVSVQAVRQWLICQDYYRRFCRILGGRLLVPLPVVRVYLNGARAARRPRGWWGTARTADHLGVDVSTVRDMIHAGKVDAVQHGRTYFIDPYSLPALRRPASTDVPVVVLQAFVGVSLQATHKALAAGGHVVTVCRRGTGRAAYVTPETARRFLSARGHRAEVVETYLRRALLVGEKGKR